MKLFSFKDYLNGMPQIHEEIHQDIKDTLDSPNIRVHNKLNLISKHIRKLISNGETTGLQDSKPKKGSSRAVFFPSEPHKLNIDGHDTEMHTALKVAFPGTLDKYNKSGHLLGEHQNMVEGDHYTAKQYGMLSHDRDNNYHTNHEGVLAPMLHSHEDGHHVLFGKIHPVKAGDFKNLTKTPEFPKGISHQEMFDNLNHHYNAAHGRSHYGTTSHERISEVDDHPFVRNMQNMIADTGAHPADYNKGNMGVWEHPVTKQKHLVVSDYGFSTEVAKHYQDARKNQMSANRGY